jgi:hypothetical protein
MLHQCLCYQTRCTSLSIQCHSIIWQPFSPFSSVMKVHEMYCTASLLYKILFFKFHILDEAQTPTQPSRGNEKNMIFYTSTIIIDLIQPSHVSSYKPYFFTISFDDWQKLQWWLGLVWLWHQKHICVAKPWSREFLNTVRYMSCNCGTQLLLCPCTCRGVRNSL